jgi:O-antigen/teichoic acid export membrane protein
MKAHLSNAAYGVFDYAAHPIGMLLVAPPLLHHLGVAQYGVWVIATAAVSGGSIIASGFGDANIQYIARLRSRGDVTAVQRSVRSTMGINLLLGVMLALAFWGVSSPLAKHIASANSELEIASLWALRIASLLVLVRAVESVCISTQRAFERYGSAVRISIVARLLTLVVAVLLACYGFDVISIMVATAVLMVLGTVFQLAGLKRHLTIDSLMPSFDRVATSALFGFGIFSWLQAVSGVIFSQSDRLILGASLGATSVTAYALCVQMTQPIYGVAASGLHFLFPYLSGLQATKSLLVLKKTIFIAFTVNLFVVSVETAAALLLGRSVLRMWVGEEIAQSASVVLAPIVWSFALLGLNVTGYYTMLALGHVRVVTGLNLAGGIAMLLMMALLLPRMGINGIAIARLFYGLSALFIYLPLIRLFRDKGAPLSASGAYPVCEDI